VRSGGDTVILGSGKCMGSVVGKKILKNRKFLAEVDWVHTLLVREQKRPKTIDHDLLLADHDRCLSGVLEARERSEKGSKSGTVNHKCRRTVNG